MIPFKYFRGVFLVSNKSIKDKIVCQVVVILIDLRKVKDVRQGGTNVNNYVQNLMVYIKTRTKIDKFLLLIYILK